MAETHFSTQEFVSIVAHDLRAPIRHLRQFSNILAESLVAPTGEQLQCVEFIKTSSQQCGSMMDALTELSRLHTQPLEAVSTDFTALLREACAELAAADDCEPQLSISNCADRQPLLDPQHAKLLIAALAENAFKFRRQDCDLKLRLELAIASGQHVIKLTDNGIGIAPHFVPHCTTIFKQLNKRVDGVGMGLAVVENIAHLYDGTITIESSVDDRNSGTAVTVSLPVST